MGTQKGFWGTLDQFYESGGILGRKVANARFMDFLLAADPFDEYHFFLNSQPARRDLRATLASLAPNIAAREGFKVMDRRELPDALARGGYRCFHQSDCITYQPHLARLRNAYSPEIFPITGVTHSLSYADYARQFLQHLWPGATPRDCIVSTSTAGVRAVEQYLEALRRDYGLSDAFARPSVRRVPLGIDPGTYTPGQGGGEVCNILVFGRISHFSKMDLLPLFRALHRLFADGLDPSGVRLVLGGWTEDEDDFTPTLGELARNIGLELVIEARPTEAEKVRIFREADIFVTIADNPQETFGITVLEAAAFGLPCIASDYDGYKDLVVDGETGIRVPTVGAVSTLDADLMAPFVFDSQYHLMLAQQTVVRIPDLAEAIRSLVENSDLRRSMGAAARRRVEENYSWSAVIRQYVQLWDELWREPVDEEALRALRHPGHITYSEIFGHYCTQNLSPDMALRTGRTGEAMYRGKDFPLLYAGMERIIDPEVLRKIAFLARKSIHCDELLRKIAEISSAMLRDRAEYHVLWALKHDILELQ
ncbi:glycosyltransferase family 4 protein [Salidesulfovibrio onnuriiensis]|uniref:glycosyltransferase family 4 protein n=1 Tax=Salidesulfovibrio onnuriiensis TaxID=2583823 RepID=UPI0011CBF42B|nr:glycosyltransferase family 4 protein [Salidesulfovibrio onnuriiensis]